MKYSVFISYRRDGAFDTACLIAEKLRNRGYRVFLDVESLRSGKFNEQLYSVIEQCDDFVLVLPAGGLDRCENQDDWLRMETMCAMRHGKNIIPVMLKGFVWPSTLPEGMEGLDNYQGIAAGDISYFDASVERLVSYLKSRPALFSRRIVRYSAIGAAALCIAATGFLVFGSGNSLHECREQVAGMVSKLSMVNVLIDEANSIAESWVEFYDKYDDASSVYAKKELVESMGRTLDFYAGEIEDFGNTDTLHLDERQKKALRRSGLDPAAVEIFHNSLFPTFVADLEDHIAILRAYLGHAEISEVSVSTARINAEIFALSANSLYYAFMSETSDLQAKAMEPYLEVSASWTNLPSETGPGASKEEYERLQALEWNKISGLMADVGYMTTSQVRDLEIAESRAEKLAEDVKALKIQEEVIEHVDRIISKTDELSSRQKELQEAADKIDEMVRSTIEKCRLNPDDDQYYMWGKIIRLGSLMSLTQASRENAAQEREADRQEAEKLGFDTSGWFEPVYRYSPDDILDELLSGLDEYAGYFPETLSYVPQAKLYFSAVCSGDMRPGGMIVIATKDNLPHPVLKIGDIVLARNGQAVNTADEFSASKNTGSDEMVYLRMDGDVLRKYSESVPENEVLVGLLPLTE